jgi:hypothetical protein
MPSSNVVEMQTLRSVAHDLLSKWKAERRLIHASVAAAKGELLFKIVCTLDVVNDKSIRLNLVKSPGPMGEQTFLDLQISRAKFEVIAAEDVPGPLRSTIARHDSLIYVRLPEGVSVALLILPPVEEFP